MKRDELQKIIDEQLPGFEVVETDSDRRNRANTALPAERPADALKRRTAGRRTQPDAGTPREAAPRGSASRERVGRDQFFSDPDPRVGLRRRASRVEDRDDSTEQTVVVKVRPTGRVEDSTDPSGSTKSILIKGKRIVGFQG